jgi:hypothetical protein
MMQMPSNGDAWNVVLTYRYKYICGFRYMYRYDTNVQYI